jgi:uncharacterized protein (DUF433 family)
MLPVVDDTIELSEYIEFRWFDGMIPHVKDRRIPVSVLAAAAGDRRDSVEAIAQNYELSEAQVLAALFYYSMHADEVDRADEAYRRRYPAPDEKLMVDLLDR